MANSPPSNMIYTLINGNANLVGWTIGKGFEADASDRRITCIDTGGLAPNPKWLLDFPTVQVVVRGGINDYEIAFQKAKIVKDLCLGCAAQVIDGDRLDSVTLSSDVYYIGRDEKQRHKFTINFNLIVEPAANAITQRLAL